MGVTIIALPSKCPADILLWNYQGSYRLLIVLMSHVQIKTLRKIFDSFIKGSSHTLQYRREADMQ